MLIVRVGENIDKRKDSEKRSAHLSKMCDSYIRGAEIDGVKQYLGENIWGGVLRIKIEDWNIEDNRDTLYKYLEEISESKNIFIIDEMDMLDSTFKKLAKHASESYDCREVKVKDTRSFDLANYILNNYDKDRKRKAWLMYTDLIKTEPIESIIGAINYKIKMSRAGEAEKMFYDNLYSVSMSHDGRANAVIDLEKKILSL